MIKKKEQMIRRLERLKEDINKEVDYTPCCDHGHECKSSPVFGVIEWGFVRRKIDKVIEEIKSK